jgi:hypothetical protein
MYIKDSLLAGHSRARSEKISRYIGKNPERFAALMQTFFSSQYRVAQRAAWPMSICVETHPDLIKPYLKKLIRLLEKPGIHDALPRNTLRILQFVDIPKSLQGPLMNQCFIFIQSPQSPAAIKAFAITILSKFSAQYPDILPELKTILLSQWANEGPAFRSRARKILR